MKPIDPDVEALIIGLRDSRRRHLEARLARDALIRAQGGRTNDERAVELDRTASSYWHDCEELVWRLRFALASSSPAALDSLLHDGDAAPGHRTE